MKKQGLHPRTECINHKQKYQAKLARLAALRWLSQTFPKAFNNQTEIQPLKIGIAEDLLTHAAVAAKAGVSKTKLREALVVFTRRIDYLACLKAREMRIDLYGNPVSQVTQAEAEAAAIKIKRRIEKSAKNARKISPERSLSTATSKKTPELDRVSEHVLPRKNLTPHHYPSYTAPMDTGHFVTAKNNKPSIIVKPSRTFDPDTVARLKQKLGLSHKEIKAD